MNKLTSDTQRQYFTDKSGPCRGCLKDGIITVWRKDMPKREFSFSVAVGEVKSALRSFGNPNWVLFSVANDGLCRANDSWINNTSDDTLRQKRRQAWENDDLLGRDSCAQTRTADSAARVIRALLFKEKEHDSRIVLSGR